MPVGWPGSAGDIVVRGGEMTATTNCPSCASADVRLKVPEAPESLSYRCGNCGASWTVDADVWLLEALDAAGTPAPEA